MTTDPRCFAAHEGGVYCTATTYDVCKGLQCPFFKTREQFAESQRKVDKRLARINGTKPVGKAGHNY